MSSWPPGGGGGGGLVGKAGQSTVQRFNVGSGPTSVAVAAADDGSWTTVATAPNDCLIVGFALIGSASVGSAQLLQLEIGVADLTRLRHPFPLRSGETPSAVGIFAVPPRLSAGVAVQARVGQVGGTGSGSVLLTLSYVPLSSIEGQ